MANSWVQSTKAASQIGAHITHVTYYYKAVWSVTLTRNGEDFTADSVSGGNVNTELHMVRDDNYGYQNVQITPGTVTANAISLTTANPTKTTSNNTITGNYEDFGDDDYAYYYTTDATGVEISPTYNINNDIANSLKYVNPAGTTPTADLSADSYIEITKIVYQFELSDTPEPSSVALILVGGISLLLRRRRV